MGLGKKLKKAVSKAVGKGVSTGLNVVTGGMFHALGGDDAVKGLEEKASGEAKKKQQEADAFALAEENRKIAAQESEYRAGVDRQKNFNDELAEQSKTDYAGMGGLIGDDLGGELVGYKKKKYGLIGV